MDRCSPRPQIAFVAGNEPVSFTLTDRTAAYVRMTDTLKHFRHAHRSRVAKGLLRKRYR